MGFFRRKAEGYRSAAHVERYRARAVELRQSDPETYAQIVSQANGSEAESAARRDPDAYVALFLHAWDDVDAPPAPADLAEAFSAGGGAIDYWPELNLDAAWAKFTEFWHLLLSENGKEQLYFPDWVVRRSVVLNGLLEQLVELRPEVAEELAGILGFDGVSEPDPMREDPAVDAALDACLARNHLSHIVEAFARGLNAEK